MACYLGRECAIKDYSNFAVNKIYSKVMPMAAPPHLIPSIMPKGAKVPEGVTAHVTVKLRGVNCDGYFSKIGEKETYKVLHQIEFCSFREQALLSAKLSAASQNHMYDEYYESE